MSDTISSSFRGLSASLSAGSPIERLGFIESPSPFELSLTKMHKGKDAHARKKVATLGGSRAHAVCVSSRTPLPSDVLARSVLHRATAPADRT